jgi:hypothetical protein
VTINDSLYTYSLAQTPWGGVKESGLGRTHGKEGLLEMVRTVHVSTDRFYKIKKPWWYPYNENVNELFKNMVALLGKEGVAEKAKTASKMVRNCPSAEALAKENKPAAWQSSCLLRWDRLHKVPMQSTTKPFDMAIIGAGPAGAYLAYRLAAAGVKIALFDPKVPWEKPCGGGITHKAWSRFPLLTDPALVRNEVSHSLQISPGNHSGWSAKGIRCTSSTARIFRR